MRRWFSGFVLLVVVFVAAACGRPPGERPISVGAAGPPPSQSPATTTSAVSIPATAASAVDQIGVGLGERGQDPASAGCVAQRLDAEFTGGELKFAIALLSTPHPSDAQVGALVEATGLGTVPGDLPQRVFLTAQACIGETSTSSTSSSVTTATAVTPSSSVVTR
ncbi:MAG: hypothetical protein U0Q07_06745 [Acidimicrobiales bacterium]